MSAIGTNGPPSGVKTSASPVLNAVDPTHKVRDFQGAAASWAEAKSDPESIKV